MKNQCRGSVATDDLLRQAESCVENLLQKVDAIFRSELENHDPLLADILTHVTRLRGKRLRPILLILSAQATGGVRDEHLVLAAVVEMIHTATLVHDDVLDEATLRRHVATVNSRWNNETSVLFGDYLFTHAFHLASSLESTLACRRIGRATNIVCEGELLQVLERGNDALTEESYLRIIDRKTAELWALCCWLGAHFSGADPSVTNSIEAYGRSLGVAFQIADDVLDLTGSEPETGKSLGTDLRKQKWTLPIIRLLERATGGEAERIRELLSDPGERTGLELDSYLRKSDAIEYARSRAREYTQVALRHLSGIRDSKAKQILENIADFVAHRSC